MSLATALQGLKETQPKLAAIEKPVRVRKPPVEAAPSSVQVAERRAGKSSRDDYEKVGLYIQTDLRRRAFRKFEDNGGRDLSDLVENLLTSYLDA